MKMNIIFRVNKDNLMSKIYNIFYFVIDIAMWVIATLVIVYFSLADVEISKTNVCHYDVYRNDILSRKHDQNIKDVDNCKDNFDINDENFKLTSKSIMFSVSSSL